jgi:CelD/BcsL family acetyltransferase involved in cellulose biosynthesis
MMRALWMPEVPSSLSATTARFRLHDASIPSSIPLVGMDVCLIEDTATFDSMGAEWNDLVERTRNEPFYRHEFIRTWIENFSPDAPLRVLAGRDHSGRLVAVLPLVEERIRMFGIPLRQWVSPTNVQSFRFDLLAEDKEAASRAFLAYLRVLKGWDVLRITDVPPDGNAWQLHETARRKKLPVGIYESQRSTYITLPASFEALQGTLGGKFRGNLRRRRKLLETKGTLSIERTSGGPDLQAQLEECFLIEQSGWKGQRGEPANLDPRIHGFLSTLAQRTSKNGSFELFRLMLDGRPIAFHYGLTQNGVYSLLVTSYDESLRDCSPGHLLVEEVLKICIQNGRREFDFLGCDLEWKRTWSSTSRQHTWLFIFRNSVRGRLLHSLKFEVKPAVKRLLSRSRR